MRRSLACLSDWLKMADTETLIGATNRNTEPQGPHQRKKSFLQHIFAVIRRYGGTPFYAVSFCYLSRFRAARLEN
ncbi:hypothetical protein FOPG_03082 [Fusarium oxysporum f. sp. conglutinans race 2 54008]|uniref:Uncharacterized protein n=2 Tax=Fusarium oxysporum TaxID=5507 RepID=X0M254_FUSOX|nr:hypothetical protein FOPG_03082 [Fusarium oxysporum f. sp. conglutinans race 2 54008]EXM32294.1 hypothetical protein FOTG_02723 [Fusarium oxysporum f. sp. vasinfectum 25433]